MTDNARVITEYVNAWGKGPAGDLADYFTEDGIYYTLPGVEPLRGREAIRRSLNGEAQHVSSTNPDSSGGVQLNVEILNLVADGDVVMMERSESVGSGENKIEFRAATVFLMEGGKIKMTRSYFDRDMGTLVDPELVASWAEKGAGAP